MDERPYHHGNLRRALLAAAVDVVEESGTAAVSLRDLARRAGVSHAAPAHHFADKTGLLTAMAAEGFDLLADELEAAHPPADIYRLGAAYVSFATGHRAHFDVMFRPDLYRSDDPALVAAQQRAGAALRHGVAALPPERRGADPELARISAWSLVHGFTTLWLQQMLPPGLGESPEQAFRSISTFLFGAHATPDRPQDLPGPRHA
ncbi:TetR/AcrR family transcriptional regulator [Ruania zhangjianzhongii]|uniref:TetR/AcrR family transcriptional regulator n=1 Tax=Ruania zhangjianzhongii TaxID=2603206 RepID=UPI0011C9BAF4|nr:TetR/AcrR family transcriptional regulator [Ruania zhangjianzhongii]